MLIASFNDAIVPGSSASPEIDQAVSSDGHSCDALVPKFVGLLCALYEGVF